jgi:simple sugar transport system substrate-binding protein
VSRRLALAALTVAVALAGCGDRKVVRERAVTVPGETTPLARGDRADAAGGAVRIVVITHGQASSPFWAIVRNGVEAAARQMDVVVSYRAPDIYSVERMKALIEQAVERRPDGLVVSLPEPAVEPAVRRAARAGVPVVTINSGSDVFRRLGVLAHVGQPEYRAGLASGRRLAGRGVRRALCVNQQVGNQGLDARCAGLASAMRRAGGRSRVLGVSDASSATPRRIARAIRAGRVDGVLTTNSKTAVQAVDAVRGLGRARRVTVGAFDLSPDVLRAVRSGRLEFAVDQQPYLQGYLPVVMLTQRARYGLFPAQDEVVATGPNFVTRRTATKATELSRRSIR